jgi:hypothetical protein
MPRLRHSEFPLLISANVSQRQFDKLEARVRGEGSSKAAVIRAFLEGLPDPEEEPREAGNAPQTAA